MSDQPGVSGITIVPGVFGFALGFVVGVGTLSFGESFGVGVDVIVGEAEIVAELAGAVRVADANEGGGAASTIVSDALGVPASGTVPAGTLRRASRTTVVAATTVKSAIADAVTTTRVRRPSSGARSIGVVDVPEALVAAAVAMSTRVGSSSPRASGSP